MVAQLLGPAQELGALGAFQGGKVGEFTRQSESGVKRTDTGAAGAVGRRGAHRVEVFLPLLPARQAARRGLIFKRWLRQGAHVGNARVKE
ncbi:hypothetical protein BEN49_15210 [Hymenobacter coccineus]|uniref:Uncharacterized protein n=1 Tax=Hymenobacter coccineus TaxID=1908235 RepID=A0A1G1SSP0_9BACT|nr:hypothetical protein BEN49_15210 [Hymenobacter coccineus]